jgi:hypothetical protein
MRARAAMAALMLVALASGCRDPDQGLGNGNGDEAFRIEAPAPPASPTPPSLAPCPEGWREVARDDVTVCEPWPEAGPQDCPVDAMHLPGTSGCAEIGTACTGDGWPSDLPSDAEVVFVRAGAAPGGDGSRDAPLPTVAEGIAASGSGAIVAIAAGTYDEALNVPAGRTLWGACVAQTRIAASTEAAHVGTLNVTGSGAVVRNLQIGGLRPAVSVNGSGRSIAIEEVAIAEATGIGIVVANGGRADVRASVIRETAPNAAGNESLAVAGVGQSEVTLSEVLFVDNHDSAIFGSGPFSVSLSDVAIRRTRPLPASSMWGVAMYLEDGVRVSGSRVVMESHHGASVWGIGSGVEVDLEDVVIRDTDSYANNGQEGRGLQLFEGARAHLRRALFERNHAASVAILREGSWALLEDVVIRDTQSEVASGQMGLGVSVWFGGELTVHRGEIAGNRGGGAVAIEATMRLEDVVVRATGAEAQADGLDGWGVIAFHGGHIEADRLLVDENAGVGVMADFGSTLEIADLTVRHTAASLDGTLGRGLLVQDESEARLTRVLLEGNRELAMCAYGAGTIMAIEDLEIRGTHSNADDGIGGQAFSIQDGAQVTLARALFSQNREAALSVVGRDATLVAEDVAIESTLERACAQNVCAGYGAGVGVVVEEHGYLDLTRFSIKGSPLAGVQLAGGGEADLTEGAIVSNLIGANVQTAGYDVQRLMSQVRWEDNDVDLDADVHPVPEAHPPAEFSGL